MVVASCSCRQAIRTAWFLQGALLAFLLALTATGAFPQEGERTPAAQDRNQTSDWVKDNLDVVAASATDIHHVLASEPGLMVELKRLMAKQAAERGQIVSAEDLEDSNIYDRLEDDADFRALATRLLQRYGYLTPQMNPKSVVGQEQELLIRARTEQLVRNEEAGGSMGRALPSSQLACGPGEDNSQCQSQTGTSAQNLSAEPAALCDPEQDELCPAAPLQLQMPYPAEMQGPLPNASPAMPGQPTPEIPEGPQELPPDYQRLDESSSTLLMAGDLSDNAGAETDAGAPGQQGEITNTGLEKNSYSRAGSTPAQPGYYPGSTNRPPSGSYPPQNSGEYPGYPAASGYPGYGAYPGYPAYANRQIPYRRENGQQTVREPVDMVRSPNPYAYVPSLYDLYVQAAPRNKQLERFGLQAFRSTPYDMGIPMDLPAGPDYVLGPGDGLTIDLWGGVAQRLFRTVDREGRLSLPEAGPLLVSGKTLGDVQETVQRVLRTQFRDVSADLSLSRLRTVRVYVVGDVVSPGAYDVSSLSTPLNALWAAGGINARGSLRRVRHSRGSQLVEEVDLYDLLLRGVRGDLKNLENGDTLLVPPAGPQVKVDGMVRRPAIYELNGETNLAEALDLAGGILPAGQLRHIEVQRLEAHEKRTMFSVDIDNAGDPQAVRARLASFAVRDGDEVHIYPIAPYNSATVYLQGHVLRPGRYAYRADMRVTDLLASYQDLLPEPASHYAEIIRLTQPDWRPVVQNFDLAAAFANPQAAPKLQPLDTVRIFGRFDVEPPPVVWVSGEVRRPGQYRTAGQMHLRDAIYDAGGLLPEAALDSAQLYRTEPDGSLKILNVNLGAALTANGFENVLVEPRDRIIVHRSLYRVDPPSVFIKGEVASPGRYPLGNGMRLVDLLDAAGGAKRSADLSHVDLMRYQSLAAGPAGADHEKVDLTAILRNPGTNIPLKDGDVLSVPQLPGWTALGASITVKGEVKNPGVYGISQGERLSSVLQRAGGILPTAYPQGSVFTRLSVRDMQEKTRQQLVQRLEQESPTIKASLGTSMSEAAAMQQQALQQRERIVEGLKEAPVSGRMVVRLNRDLKGFEGSSQDIEVRNGDSIEIPKRPDVVLVVGQVYNTNAITYVPDKNAQWYLAQGGGPTQLGDKGAIFIVRADGEVVSRHQGGWWTGNVLSTMVRPGDTIVVPEKVAIGDSRWRTVLALAQAAAAAGIWFSVIP